MQSTDFKTFSYDDELQRAKWFKEDLEKGGWDVVHRSPGSIFWMKTFQEQEVPLKTLFMFDMPMPAKKILEVMHWSNIETRRKWDQAFLDHEILESYPDGSFLTVSQIKVSWPLRNRSFVLFRPAVKEVDWYGQEAFMLIQKNAWHPSRPAGSDGCVRATNGGNFTIIIPNKDNPTEECKMFGLRNNYNGNFPKTKLRFVLAKKIPKTFNLLREGIIDGYNKYFKNDE
ncbi:uncharacterized protein LOC144630407 [Oculina patagonica]